MTARDHGSRRWGESVRTGGALSVGEDDDIDRSFLRSQFETELRKRREDVGQVCTVRRKAQDELVSGFCVGLVSYGTVSCRVRWAARSAMLALWAVIVTRLPTVTIRMLEACSGDSFILVPSLAMTRT